MDRIHYAGESLLTGSDIASALLGYAQALAGVGASDTVEIPILDEDGAERRATFVIGPASQLISIAEPDGHPELEDAGVVAVLHEKTAALGTRTAVSADDSIFGPDADFEL